MALKPSYRANDQHEPPVWPRIAGAEHAASCRLHNNLAGLRGFGRPANLPRPTKQRNNRGISMTNRNPTRNTLIGAAALGLLTLVSTTRISAGADSSVPAQAIPYSITAEAGTTGIGGNVGWRFLDNLGVDGGFDYFDYSRNGKIKDNKFDASLRLMSQPLNLDVYPWERSSFHIALGALFNENHISGGASGSLKLDNQPYTGHLALLYKQNLVSPYLGIGGNLYFDHAHHWSLMGALGAAYVGEGSVSLTPSTTPRLNAAQNAGLQRELSKIKKYHKRPRILARSQDRADLLVLTDGNNVSEGRALEHNGGNCRADSVSRAPRHLCLGRLSEESRSNPVSIAGCLGVPPRTGRV